MKSIKTLFAEEKKNLKRESQIIQDKVMNPDPEPTVMQRADMHQRIYKIADFLEETIKDFEKNGYKITMQSGGLIETRKPLNDGKSDFLHLHHIFAIVNDAGAKRHLATVEARSVLDPRERKKPLVEVFCGKADRQWKTAAFDPKNGKLRAVAKEMVRREIVRNLIR